jgi:hypothetical protein
MPTPHNDDNTPQHPGFINNNYGKELTPIGDEYNLPDPRDNDPPQDSFFDNQGPASIDPELYRINFQRMS